MRYAIYFAPPPGSALAEAGADWLGRCAHAGTERLLPAVEGVDPDRFAAVTAEARRYGWHATLKPPFALAPGRREADLVAAFRDFAAVRPAIALDLAVARVDGFLALTPVAATLDLDGLAGACVSAFDGFRAPPPADELARRRRAGLSARQEELLAAWGYPYVFDEFRFHMTLTSRVAGAEADVLEAAARAHFAAAVAEPVAIDTLALFAEPAPGAPFTVLESRRLADA